MQCAQVAAFLYIHFVRIRPTRCCKCYQNIGPYVSWIMCATIYIFVPVISVIHWLINISTALDGANFLRPWLFTYPMMGVITILTYFLHARDYVVRPLRERVHGETINVWDKRIDDIINDERIGEGIIPEEENAKRFKKFLFGDPFPIEVSNHKVLNVCESAAIYTILKSYERKKYVMVDGKQVKRAVKMNKCLAKSEDWVDIEDGKDAEQRKAYESFLNECYTQLQRKEKRKLVDDLS